MFAKLFESRVFGQILVKIDSNEDSAPEVRVYLQPKDLGVCSAAMTFKDSDAGWDNAEILFTKFDLERAEAFARQVCSSMGLESEYQQPSAEGDL